MDLFNIKIFEDEQGTRFIYCDSAIAAISGPSPDDKIIAEFSCEHETLDDIEPRLLKDRGWYQRGDGTWSHEMVSWLSSLFEKITKHLDDVSYWRIVGIVDSPNGARQTSDTEFFDHEYVEQWNNYEDDWHGNIYLPIGNRYLKIEFNS